MIHDVKVLVLGTYIPIVAQLYIFVNTNYGIFFRKCKFIDIAFVRSGRTDLYIGKAYAVGQNVYSWSSTSSLINNAYYLRYNSTTVGPSVGGYRFNGFPLRCRFCPCGVDLLVLYCRR